jgi:hypothetical protein
MTLGKAVFERNKKEGRRVFFRQIFPKTQLRYPVYFDWSPIKLDVKIGRNAV